MSAVEFQQCRSKMVIFRGAGILNSRQEIL
jgi:hypothetical protein